MNRTRNHTQVDTKAKFSVAHSFVSRVYFNGYLVKVLESDTVEGLAKQEQRFIKSVKASKYFQAELFESV